MQSYLKFENNVNIFATCFGQYLSKIFSKIIDALLEINMLFCWFVKNILFVIRQYGMGQFLLHYLQQTTHSLLSRQLFAAFGELSPLSILVYYSEISVISIVYNL